MSDRLDLPIRYRDQVEALLREHVPGIEVWAYGSRVNGESHDASDLDLVLRGPDLERIPGGQLADLNAALEDSNVPIIVQIHDWARLPESFHREIERAYVVLVEGKEQNIANNWHKTTLGDLLSFSNGKSSPERSDDLPHPVYGSNGIIGFSDKTNADPNTIIVGRVGTYCGSLQYSNRMCWVTDNAIRANAISGNDAKFIFYLLQTLQLNDWRTGSGQPLLNQSILSSIRVTVPDPTEQRAIAHILGPLDDKIELNRRMNETLEEMARALFKSWFVDFDPVRAKMEGRDPGLPKHLADLFPDRLVDSVLGPIPDGWEVKALEECLDVAKGLSYKGAGLSSDGVPMHNLNSIYEGGGYKDDGIKYYNGDYQSRHVIQPGEVIVANTEQGHDRLLIGFAAIVPKRFGDNGLFSHHIYRVRPKDSFALTPDFICQLLNTHVMHSTVSGYANGTTVNMLPADALRIPLIVIPSPQIVTMFSTIAEAARIRQEKCIVDSQTLIDLSDALLPRLVSGELRLNTLNIL